MRWVIRQRNRMLLQADAVDLERRMRFAHEAKEAIAFNGMIDKIKENAYVDVLPPARCATIVDWLLCLFQPSESCLLSPQWQCRMCRVWRRHASTCS